MSENIKNVKMYNEIIGKRIVLRKTSISDLEDI